MRIRWSGPAVRDFTEICDYIGEHGSAATARRLALSIYERIGILTKFPEFGRAGRQPNTRELVLTGLPYLAVYRLRGDSIEILRLLHGAQDWPSSGSDQL
jgi:toxin ParE1/3/4